MNENKGICSGDNSNQNDVNDKSVYKTGKNCDAVISYIKIRLQSASLQQIHLSESHYATHRWPRSDGWRRGVVRASVFGWRTFPDLRLIYS